MSARAAFTMDGRRQGKSLLTNSSFKQAAQLLRQADAVRRMKAAQALLERITGLLSGQPVLTFDYQDGMKYQAVDTLRASGITAGQMFSVLATRLAEADKVKPEQITRAAVQDHTVVLAKDGESQQIRSCIVEYRDETPPPSAATKET